HGAKDQLTMLDRVGKAAFRAGRTEDIAPVMREAVAVARAGRPGPVSVEIPIDQQYRAIDVEVPAFESPCAVEPDAGALDRAAELLARAQRPLIWAGGGVISSGPSRALGAL